MSIDRLEAAARKAADHPELRWVFTDLPKGYADSPNALRRLLVACAEGLPLANSEAYRAAHSALVQVEEARALRDKIGALYHDPKVQRAAADRGIDWYLQHPEAIKEALRDPKIADMLGANLVERIGVTVIESAQFRQEHGIPDAPPPADVPIPSEAGARETEMAALRAKSINNTITKAESDRLDALYAARIAAEESGASEELAAHKKALGIPATARTGDGRFRPASDEYRALIDKSLRGGLSPAEDARLTEMSGQRAAEQGLVSQADLAAEQE